MNGILLHLLSVLAWGGAIATVLAYALVSRGRLSARSAAFQGVNTVGAALLGLNVMVHGNWTSAASNGVWMIVGLQALVLIGWPHRQLASVHPLRPVPPSTPTPTAAVELTERAAA